MRRLEDAGVIEGYTVRLNARAVGLPLAAYLRIRPMPGELNRVAAMLAALPQVIAWDRVRGRLLHREGLVPTVEELEALIDGLLPYATTNTSVIVSTTVAQRVPNLG